MTKPERDNETWPCYFDSSKKTVYALFLRTYDWLSSGKSQELLEFLNRDPRLYCPVFERIFDNSEVTFTLANSYMNDVLTLEDLKNFIGGALTVLLKASRRYKSMEKDLDSRSISLVEKATDIKVTEIMHLGLNLIPFFNPN